MANRNYGSDERWLEKKRHPAQHKANPLNEMAKDWRRKKLRTEGRRLTQSVLDA